MKATYWVVQHIADVFRNEPRNVGVLVSFNEQKIARFFGEDEDYNIDGRKIKKLPYPSVYRQWVKYWRRTMPNVEAIVAQTTNNYRVVLAGELTDVQGETVSEVADFLFSVLVSEGAIWEALQDREAHIIPSIRLDAEVEKSLFELELMDKENNDLFVAHPVRREAEIEGRVTRHTPAFSQMNGSLYVIESVDLTSGHKKPVRDHAGWAAYMFHDIREIRDRKVETISIVKATENELNTQEGDYILKVLRNESDVVDWLDPTARATFLAQRKSVAFS